MRKLILLIILVTLVLSCKKMETAPPAVNVNPSQIKYADQINVLKEVLQKHPENIDGWINLGNMLMDSGRFSEATQAYSKALELNPNNVDVRVDMATCFKESGKPSIAEEEYRKAIKINPKHPYAHRNLGVLLATDLARKSEAIKEFETYLTLSPNAPDAGNVMRIISELKATSEVKK